jgi:hypothetical protein
MSNQRQYRILTDTKHLAEIHVTLEDLLYEDGYYCESIQGRYSTYYKGPCHLHDDDNTWDYPIARGDIYYSDKHKFRFSESRELKSA